MADKNTPKVKEVKAFARYVHVSPRKLRLVADMIRKTPVAVALEQLRFSSKNAAEPLSKVINSAIANAVHNFDLDRDTLYVKAVTIDGGPVYKRYAPRAQGRAFIERKRTSHINVILESRPGAKKSRSSIFTRAAKSTQSIEGKKHDNAPESGKVSGKQIAPKQAPRPEEKLKQNKVNMKRRLFNRKSGE